MSSELKFRSFGGVYIKREDTSPKVNIGKNIDRKESKIYNFNLSFDQALRLQHALSSATSYLSMFRENTKAHRDGIRLVVNFETGRIDFQKP